MTARVAIIESDPHRRGGYARCLREDPNGAHEVMTDELLQELAPHAAFVRLSAEHLDCVVLGPSLSASACAELAGLLASLDPARRCAVVLLRPPSTANSGEDDSARLGVMDVAGASELTDAGLRRMVNRAIERAALQRALARRDRELESMQSELRATFAELSESHEHLKQANDLARYQATHDALTGLANRDLFLERLEQAVEYARRHGHSLGVLVLGLDRFRELNATLGSIAGDEVLRAVGRRVAELTRRSDFAGRIGGDEFVIALTNMNELHYAALVARRIVARLSAPYRIGERDLFVTPSIGIALFPANGTSAPQLLAHADVAMRDAKTEGGRAFRFYERRMNESAYDRLMLENALRKAIKQGEIVLHYQPQVDIWKRRAIGVEALARWQHPERGLLAAGQFVPIAERSDLMLTLGDWVLREAVRQQVQWRGTPLGDLPVSVNVSFRQVRAPDFCQSIEDLLREFSLDPKQVKLEITESMIMDDVELAVAQLHQLKKLGVGVSIDDFGTGYSSLAALSSFPIDTLKIDRSFVQQIESHERRAAIAQAVVSMAQGLGFQTIAEGVETEAEFEFLQRLGCMGVQGFLVAQPLSPERLATWLQEMKWQEAARGKTRG